MFFLFLSVTFEKIIAVVEKDVITSSYLENVSSFYPGFPRTEIIKKIVNERIIYYAAVKESLEVTDEEIDEAFKNNIQNFPSLIEIIKGENEKIYRNELKYQLYAQKLIGKKYLSRVNVKKEELLRFYNDYKDSFYIHPSVTLEKVSIEIGKREKERLIKKCEEIIEKLKTKSFEELVIEYSEDVGTKYSGGRLGEFYLINLPPYFSGVDTIPVGKTGIFFSPEGAHILKVNSRVSGKIGLSHIFLKFNLKEKEISEGMKEANELRTRWIKGETIKTDTMPELSFAILPDELKDLLGKLNVGDISEPVLEGNVISIVKVLSKKEGGIPKFEEVEDKLNLYYFNKKLEKEYERIVEEMKNVVYYKIFE